MFVMFLMLDMEYYCKVCLKEFNGLYRVMHHLVVNHDIPLTLLRNDEKRVKEELKMVKVDLETWQMHMIREIVLNHEYSKTWFTAHDLEKLKKRVQGWI